MKSRNKPLLIHDEAFFISCGEIALNDMYLWEYTLDSGIDVGPRFINFGFFSWPYGLIKSPTFIIFSIFFQALQIGNAPKIKFFAVKALHLTFFAKLFRPYDYFFCQIF